MSKDVKTFWQFLKENTIEIPIIQRDYAQGRLGEESLRKNFLSNIKDALDKKLPNGEKVLKLDYVYGSIEGDNKLQPLDGQQRLTTLWLLHWYIAYKAGTLNDKIVNEQNSDKVDERSKDTLVKVKDILKKFTYETRISSREFCEKLATFAVPQPDDVGIVEHIKNQTWFYSAWQQDPTIQSMLRMLGGTKIYDKYGEDIIDGLEELFANTEQQKFKTYWETLISDKAPIIFYYKPLEDFGLSDDLYVKMNARGKQLTPFENFKADLINYMRRNEEGENETRTNNKWGVLLDPSKGIPIKMDTDWLDGIFWKNKSKGDKVDEIYYAFINRFFWNELFTAKKQNLNEYVLSVGKGLLANGEATNTIENNNLSYKYLNEDNYNVYADLTPYKYLDNEIPIQLFKDLENVLDNYSKYSGNICCANWFKDFKFIPEYEEENNASDSTQITSLTQVQRIMFFALCKYFKKDEDEADKESLARWMRVVCNLIAGEDEKGEPQIRNTLAVRTAIEHIDKLDSHNVYESLCEQEVEYGSAFSRRWTEEIDKAKQILNENGSLRKYDGKLKKEDNSNYKYWEDIIKDAENYAFFNGSIRFLFYNENGDVDWDKDNFDKKFENAKNYFKKEESDGSWMKETYDNADLLKALISKFDAKVFEEVLWWTHRTFNNKASSWLYYLLNPKICKPVHQLLLGKTNKTERKSSDDFYENVLYLLSKTGLLDFVMKEIPDSWIRDYHYHYAIFPSSRGVFLNAKKRDDFLLHTKGITIDDSYKITDSDLLYGSDINFRYNSTNFQWYRTNYVYLMEDENSNAYRINDENAEEEQKKYFCFDATVLNDEEIITKLNELITRYLSKENKSHESNHR